ITATEVEAALQENRTALDVEEAALVTHRAADGKEHSDVVLNNDHRVNDGSDHSFVDQDVKAAASPTFATGTFTGGIIFPAIGSIGTLVVACSSEHSGTYTQYLPNTTVSGSSLHYSGETVAAGNSLSTRSNTDMLVYNSNWASFGFTGTWRLLSRVYKGSTVGNYPVGLWQRIS
ncbi:MAG: hypothetical protein PF570_10210, partial [Candidatus Cloacimonetes bacterium]|nr:hypothetical protein [Candidatus Cloacimonadota bacterium]